MSRGLVFDVQHFSLHDGPGIRTTVFLKGCSLHCAWCHNPESISVKNGILFKESKCIGCRACETACNRGVHSFDGGNHFTDRSLCMACGNCEAVCYAGALKLIAREYDPKELAEVLLRDRSLYDRSGGGVTFSGGEPLLQADLVLETAELLKEDGIHICVDTALNVPRESIKKVLPVVDLFLCDIKAVSGDIFRRYIGEDNSLIMSNLKYISENADMYIRVPLIKGVNTEVDELEKIRELIGSLGNRVRQVGLLTYHDLGIEKAVQAGMEEERFPFLTEEEIQEMTGIFSGIACELLVDGVPV
ncbi:MAG: glycyl-radical enzyme activating protein [Clostridia bacterium]|nr:glycyl-radical enzyme activating protein [Clostridia bacterium]